MRICILTPRFPFPENGGDVLRINHIARYLKHQGHELTLVSFTEGDSDFAEASELYDHIYSVWHNKLHAFVMSLLYMLTGRPMQCGYYHSHRFRQTLQQAIEAQHPDLYIAHLLRMAPYLDKAGIREHAIIEMTDALSRTYALSTQSAGFSPMRLIYGVEHTLIQRYEDYVIRQFPKSVLVSKTDMELLQSRVDNAHVAFYTNGVTVDVDPLQVYNPHKICFVGNMRTLQNQDAVLYFVDKVLPLIVKKDPKVVFYVIGAQPSARITQLEKNAHVVVTGFVDSVEKVLMDACISVAPVHIAAGIQNKVLVAMGLRVPVVLSSLIAGAIPELKDKQNCFICDSVEEYAEACIQLMKNPTLRQQMAEAGCQMVNTSYCWDDKLAGYELM